MLFDSLVRPPSYAINYSVHGGGASHNRLRLTETELFLFSDCSCHRLEPDQLIHDSVTICIILCVIGESAIGDRIIRSVLSEQQWRQSGFRRKIAVARWS